MEIDAFPIDFVTATVGSQTNFEATTADYQADFVAAIAGFLTDSVVVTEDLVAEAFVAGAGNLKTHD